MAGWGGGFESARATRLHSTARAELTGFTKSRQGPDDANGRVQGCRRVGGGEEEVEEGLVEVKGKAGSPGCDGDGGGGFDSQI